MKWLVTLHYRSSLITPELVVLQEAGDEGEAMRDAQVLVNHGRKRLDWRPVEAEALSAQMSDTP